MLTHHVLDGENTYEVSRLTSMQNDWQDLDPITGHQSQRLAARLEPRGYALYCFRKTGK